MSDTESSPGDKPRQKKDLDREKRARDEQRKRDRARGRAADVAADRRSARASRTALERPTLRGERRSGDEPGTDRGELRKRAQDIVDANRALGVKVEPGDVDRAARRIAATERTHRAERAAVAERDHRSADLERAHRRTVPDLPNDQLLAEARRLHRDFQAESTGPLLKTEIARTLQTMRDEMHGRIVNAPRDGSGKPRLDGVDWGVNNPRAGHVDGLAPFDRSVVWERHLTQVGGATDRPRSERPPARDQTPATITADAVDRYRVTGFGTGSTDLGRDAARRWIGSLPENMRQRLVDGSVTLVVTGHASMIGSDAVNDRISRERAERFRDDLRAEGVTASILIEGRGSRDAEAAGRPQTDNSASDRRIDVTIGEPVTVLRFDRGETIEGRRTSIPREYASGYKHSREDVERWWWKPYQLAKDVVPIAASKEGLLIGAARKAAVETVRQVSDAERNRRDVERTRDVDARLWNIPPGRGFLLDQNSAVVRGRVEIWLREGGYDVEKMWPEYVMHWLRKGVR